MYPVAKNLTSLFVNWYQMNASAAPTQITNRKIMKKGEYPRKALLTGATMVPPCSRKVLYNLLFRAFVRSIVIMQVMAMRKVTLNASIPKIPDARLAKDMAMMATISVMRMALCRNSHSIKEFFGRMVPYLSIKETSVIRTYGTIFPRIFSVFGTAAIIELLSQLS
jgi:hypothetical protein